VADRDNNEQSLEEFALLDDYVERLHLSASAARPTPLAETTSLARVFDCLEALENLAPPKDLLSRESEPVGQRSQGVPSIDHAARDFGDYELIEEIGRGGMGVVYKARQKSLDRIVAVKMILASHLASKDQLARFHAESKTVAAVQHPHVVRVHEAGAWLGQHYFVMEYVPGITLAQLVQDGLPDVETAVRLVAKIARAVEHLHCQGVVHRDLKPANILLDRAGEPLVTDFGLAKIFGGDATATRSDVIVGTPSYMAPEQAAGHGSQVGPLADVYSLGAILYELITGQPPFREANPLDTLVQVLEREPALPRRINRRISRDLELICLKCLEKDPGKRYGSAAALADDLERFLTGEPVEARPPSPLAACWRWARREPALAARLAAILAFYGVELANYHLFQIVDATFHGQVTLILAAWAAASLAFQWISKRRSWAMATRVAWAGVDAASLLALLLLADGVVSPIVMVYPLWVVGSSLWFRVRLVWTVAALSLISYGVLVFDYYVLRPELQLKLQPTYYRHVDFVLMLVGLALIVAYQVRRVRALGRFYGKRQLS